jgi:hypothetical protein
MSLADCDARCASERTSVATTAKPRPDSPARAASTPALSASRLVWKADLVDDFRDLADLGRGALNFLHGHFRARNDLARMSGILRRRLRHLARVRHTVGRGFHAFRDL